MNKKLPYPISTINPATGMSDDIIATSRVAVDYLHTLCEQDEAGRYIGRFSIQKTLEEAGFTIGVPHFVLFLNFMGLVRKLNKDGCRKSESQYQYLVLDPTFFDLLVTEESIYSVLKYMSERHELQKENQAMRKRLEKLERASASIVSDDDISQMNNNLAEVIAEVERLKGENTVKDARISALEAELQATSKVDPKAVSVELMARFKQMK